MSISEGAAFGIAEEAAEKLHSSTTDDHPG
jgi:hypothetical protein